MLWEHHRYLWRADRKKSRPGPDRRSEGEGLGISLAKLPNSAATATAGISSILSQLKSPAANAITSAAKEDRTTAADAPSAPSGPATKPSAATAAATAAAAAATYNDSKSISFERPGVGAKGAEGGGRRADLSLFIDQPHVAIAGGIGALLRVPVEGTSPAPDAPAADSTGGGNPAFSALLGATLRPFASGLVSAQLGSFQRFFLDYTHVSARLDLGLTAPSAPQAAIRDDFGAGGGGAVGERPADFYACRNRAFAVEGKGVTHALSVSMAQQILGPVRGRVDLRFGLDSVPSPNAMNDRGFGWAVGGTIQHIQGLRPTLLDCVYGADVVLPKTGGAVKASAWMSPMRREAMVEVRLMG